MTWKYLVIMLFGILLFGCTALNTNNNFIGCWEMQMNGHTLYTHLDSDGTVVYSGMTGKWTNVGENKIRMDFNTAGLGAFSIYTTYNIVAPVEFLLLGNDILHRCRENAVSSTPSANIDNTVDTASPEKKFVGCWEIEDYTMIIGSDGIVIRNVPIEYRSGKWVLVDSNIIRLDYTGDVEQNSVEIHYVNGTLEGYWQRCN